MDNESLRSLKEDADAAFKNRDFGLTFDLSEKLSRENVPSAFFTCGLIMENGWINGIKDLDRALYFYRGLAIKFNDEEGCLGCVRIFLVRHETDSKEQAMRYCEGAIKGRLKHLALLLMGRVYEELYDPPKYRLARKAYLKSFFAGSAWALRKHAMSLMKSNNVIGGIFMHVVATIVSPLFVLFRGLRSTRNG